MAAQTDPIARVSAISTGSVKIRPEHVGPTRKNTYVWLCTSTRWTGPRPINVYVVEHRDGLVVFDTGQDRASVTDPGYFPGGLNGLVYSRLAKFEIGTDETLEAGMSGLGYRIEDVDTAIISHLHQDHIGGLPLLGRSELVISHAESQTLAKPLPEARGLLRSHIELPGFAWNRITPEPLADPALMPFTDGHDMFGDGSMVLLPTPGHTPGSLSLMVRRPGKAPLLMVGGLTYDAALLTAGKLPGAGDKKQMRRTISKINSLRQTMPDLTILAAHDPGADTHLKAALAEKVGSA